ncbi:TPA: ead/Ea22-like family protein [Escherichia coli]|nr:ead/Ea22-like family protein [Escherichia coli]
MTDITKLAQRMKAAAEKASNGNWVKESGDGWEACCSANDQANGGFIIAHFEGPDAAENREFVQAANPANVFALVEALEKAQAENTAGVAGMAESYETTISMLRSCIAELESSGVAPGILRCTECSFVLTKNIISVTADTITTVESEPEPCPNGCGQLQPVTWKALAIQLMFTTKQGLSDLLEAKKRIEELESDLSEWTDCKHDGATYYDMSGQERCGRCGADV